MNKEQTEKVLKSYLFSTNIMNICIYSCNCFRFKYVDQVISILKYFKHQNILYSYTAHFVSFSDGVKETRYYENTQKKFNHSYYATENWFLITIDVYKIIDSGIVSLLHLITPYQHEISHFCVLAAQHLISENNGKCARESRN